LNGGHLVDRPTDRYIARSLCLYSAAPTWTSCVLGRRIYSGQLHGTATIKSFLLLSGGAGRSPGIVILMVFAESPDNRVRPIEYTYVVAVDIIQSSQYGDQNNGSHHSCIRYSLSSLC